MSVVGRYYRMNETRARQKLYYLTGLGVGHSEGCAPHCRQWIWLAVVCSHGRRWVRLFAVH